MHGRRIGTSLGSLPHGSALVCTGPLSACISAGKGSRGWAEAQRRLDIVLRISCPLDCLYIYIFFQYFSF